MAKKPIEIYVTSKQVLESFKAFKAEGKNPSFRDMALHLMPKGVKWFESGEDWSFGLWLERLIVTARTRKNHVGGTYTFKTGKARF